MTVRSFKATLPCEQCGKEFTQDTSRQRYCSASCRQAKEYAKKLARVSRTCKTCGAVYEITARADAKTAWKDTCPTCVRKQAGAKRVSTRTCLICGTKFQSEVSEKKLCSAACAKIAEATRGQSKHAVTVSEEVAAAQARFAGKVPCAECKSGIRSVHAETGYECALNARACAPFTYRRLFKEKQQSDTLT